MESRFELCSKYHPTGDQPEAINALVENIEMGIPYQTLLGVTGSGKTFTAANVIERINRPTLVLSHNKTLAAQLYNEFKAFFPHNAVEYFVSYYDYFQPEAYLPVTDTYIEKDLAINQELEKLRLSATSSLLSGRNDVLVVSSVSCLYGIGNPEDFRNSIIEIRRGDSIERNTFLRHLVDSLYIRNEIDFRRGTFRVKGETVDIFLAYTDIVLRIVWWDDEIDEILTLDPSTGQVIGHYEDYPIYPANIFVTNKERLHDVLEEIRIDLEKREIELREEGKDLEAKRLHERVSYDMEMIRELGYCSGIENYSRYFDGRATGTRPFCLLDYFPKNFLLFIDESHVTIPQIRAMHGGDRSRKTNLVNYGFRLPSALDNRPLTFDEFEAFHPQTIYISATPAEYELKQSEGIVIEQVIRPTGLLDPEIEIRSSENQIDDLLEEVVIRREKSERVLVTTLTKRMAEELSEYLLRNGVNCAYIHSDVDTLERIQIMEDLRKGVYDVLVGVNLLREGLDLPEVSLVAILDADKEGFLRSHRSLTQTAGRAARNLNGKVIMYADQITESMRLTIEETSRRRTIQEAYNKTHHITPKTINKQSKNNLGGQTQWATTIEPQVSVPNTDPFIEQLNGTELKKMFERTKKAMYKAAEDMEYIEAARLRDEIELIRKRGIELGLTLI